MISDSGRFSVNAGKICRGDTIRVINLSGLSGDTYNYGLDSDSPIPDLVADVSQIYDTVGTFRILQSITVGGNTQEDFLFITVFENDIVPEFSVLPCSQNQIRIGLGVEDTIFDGLSYSIAELGLFDKTVNRGQDTIITFSNPGEHVISNIQGTFSDGSNQSCSSTDTTIITSFETETARIVSLEVEETSQISGKVRLLFELDTGVYQIEISQPNLNSGFQPISFVSNTNTFLIDSLNTENQFYCFRISTFDACAGSPALFSETICSIRLNVSTQPNRNLANWSTDRGSLLFERLSLNRNNIEIFSSTNFIDESFLDEDILCNVQNCYRVVYRYDNGIVSTSDSICVTSETTLRPPGINNITPTVVDQTINLSWDEIPARGTRPFEISRGFNQNTFSFIDISEQSEYIDQNANVNSNNHFYEISYTDECDNESLESVITSPVLLQFGGRTGNEFTLVWSELLGWEEGVESYTLELLSEDGNTLNLINQGLGTSEIIQLDPNSTNQDFIYRITATPNSIDLIEAQSNTLIISLEPELRVPNAFGPTNNNRLNRDFTIQGLFVDEYVLRIYNRWGEIIHFSENSGWNGRIEATGELAPAGTYAFQVDFTDFNGVNYNESGFVVFIR